MHNAPAAKLWTIGHSTRTLADFLALLAENKIELLVDVRRFAGSRRYPHFNREELAGSLAAAGIAYQHCEQLGGRRKARPDSPNIAWRNESFRGYADYMLTGEFETAFAELLEQGGSRRTTVMCSEAVWWRCHRSLIADYTKARGVEVVHILAPGKCESHPYTSAASLVEGKLTYAVDSTKPARKPKQAQRGQATLKFDSKTPGD